MDYNDHGFGYFFAGLIFGFITSSVIWLISLNSRVNIRTDSFIVIGIEQSDSKEYRYTIIPTNDAESCKNLYIDSNSRFNMGDTLKLK